MFKKFLLFIFISIGFQVSCSSSVKNEIANTEKKQENTNVQIKTLPDMPLLKFDSTSFNAQSLIGNRIIFVLFQPDCDHCQNEAKQIAERIEKFKGYTLYFISSAPLKDIEKFSIDYKLNGWPNIHFAKTEVQSIIDSYGPIPAPSLFIYSENGELVNSFEGEMEIDVVIKYL